VFLLVIFVFPGIFEFLLDVDLSEGGNVLRKSPHKVLGVGKLAGAREIKMTYRALSKKYHPDLNPDCKECADKMREINDAWEKLKRRGMRSNTREEPDTQQQENEEGNGQDSAESGESTKSDFRKKFADSIDWSYIDGTYLENWLNNWFNDWVQNLDKKWETLVQVGIRKADIDGWNEWIQHHTTGPKKKKNAKGAFKKKDARKSSGAKKDAQQSNSKHGQTAKEEEEKPYDDSLGAILRGFDSDGDGKISLEELLHHAGDTAESDVFRDGFKSADADEDGYLTAEELAYLLTQVGTEDPVESTMRGFDANQDGMISMEELLAHAGDDEGGASDMFAGWKDGFKEADANQDGYLTKEELAHLLEHASKAEAPDLVESTMRGFDADGDGKISMQELMQIAGDGQEGGATEMFEDWKHGFEVADVDKDGLLDLTELANLLEQVSNDQAKAQQNSNEEVKEKPEPVASAMKEEITIDSIALVLKHSSKQDGDQLIEESIASFIKAFDTDEDSEINLREILPGDGAESHLCDMFGNWKDSFNQADDDSSGRLAAGEFAHFLKNLSEQQLDELLDPVGSTVTRLDADKNGKISLHELLQHAGHDATGGPSGLLQGWKDGFKEADANNDGYLVVDELIHLLNNVGTHTSKQREDL